MKPFNFYARLATLGVACALAGAARATVFTYSASADPGATPDANGGAADVWTVAFSPLATTASSLLGDSGTNGAPPPSGAGAGTSAWGLRAATGAFADEAQATADVAALTGGSLGAPGQSLALDFDNGALAANGFVSVALFSTAASTTPLSQISLTFGAASYQLYDGLSTFPTLPTIAGTDDGFRLAWNFTNGTGGYDLTIGSLVLSGRDLAAGATSVGAVRVINHAAGPGLDHRLYFNNLTIVTAIPEASAVRLGAALAGAALAGGWMRRGRGATVS